METDGRIVSLDTLRGLVIMLMIFVNDVAGVSAAPGWLKHVNVSWMYGESSHGP
jgi:predicted acyltransferase